MLKFNEFLNEGITETEEQYAYRVEFGRKLKEIRQYKEISTYQMGKNGVTVQYVNAIERGSTNYTIDKLTQYLNAIDCKIIIEDKDFEY